MEKKEIEEMNKLCEEFSYVSEHGKHDMEANERIL